MGSTVAKQRAATPASRRRVKPFDWMRIGLWISLFISALIWVAPFMVLFLTSVKSPADISQHPIWALPTEWRWSNYSRAAAVGNLWVTGGNSLMISLIKVPLGLFIASMAAFALARIRFRHSKLIVGLFAVGAMIPVQVALGPLFATMLRLDLLDDHIGLLLPYIAFGIPYQIFMLYGFFRAVPDEIEESAKLDGANSIVLFFRICLPLAKPALAALFILDFVATWNEYAMATTLLQSKSNWTIPLGVQAFSTQFSTDYGPLNAYILMSAIPVLIVYLLFQRYFVQGAFSGALKG